jgi:hypothetical protein
MYNSTLTVGSLNANYVGSVISFKVPEGDLITGRIAGIRRSADYKTYTLYLDVMGSFELAFDLRVEIRS